jgi:hypothetical protein
MRPWAGNSAHDKRAKCLECLEDYDETLAAADELIRVAPTCAATMLAAAIHPTGRMN